MQVWSGLNTTSIFKDIIIESLHQNEIYFELALDHLQKALKSASGSAIQLHDVIVKLTKKNGSPYLSFTIELHPSPTMTITQDVPITLLSAQQFASLTEPHLPDPKVHVLLPPLRVLRPVVDRMKNISEFLTISANMAGSLALKVDTDLASVATFYSNLEHPTIEGRSPPRRDEGRKCTIKVDVKKFARFLFSYQINPSNVICCAPFFCLSLPFF